MIFLTDKYNNSNIIDYGSLKSRRLFLSVLGAETFALVYACNAATLLQHDLQNIPNKTLKITFLSDSAKIFDIKIINARTTENCVMVDIKAGRESYNGDIIDDIIWIRWNFNLDDAMAKPAINSELLRALNTGEIAHGIAKSTIKEKSTPTLELKKGKCENQEKVITFKWITSYETVEQLWLECISAHD